MTTAPSASRPPNPWLKTVGAVLGTAVMLTVLVIAFALPASRSAPHDVPIGVVGAPAQIQAFEKGAPGFTVHIYASEAAARTAIEHREIYGAFNLDSPTDVDVLYATAASPAVAALVQGAGQHLAQATGRTAHLTELRAFPDRDPKGVGLAAGALPLALGGWIGAMIIMLLVPDPRRRVIAAVGVAVAGGLAVVGCLQFVIGTFDGNFWPTSLAGMFGIAATCFTVLGLRELLGGPGLGIAAVLLVLLGNPLSGLATAPEMLPAPWGHLGQLLPPGATGALMRDVAFFHGHGAGPPFITLTGYLIIGTSLYLLGVLRSRRNDTVDVDKIEFDHRPRQIAVVGDTAAITEPISGRRSQHPQRRPFAPVHHARPGLPSADYTKPIR